MADNKLAMPRSPMEDHDFWKGRIKAEHERTQVKKLPRLPNRILVATPAPSVSTVTSRSGQSVSAGVPTSGFPGYSDPEQIMIFKKIHGLTAGPVEEVQEAPAASLAELRERIKTKINKFK